MAAQGRRAVRVSSAERGSCAALYRFSCAALYRFLELRVAAHGRHPVSRTMNGTDLERPPGVTRLARLSPGCAGRRSLARSASRRAGGPGRGEAVGAGLACLGPAGWFPRGRQGQVKMAGEKGQVPCHVAGDL